MAEVGTPATSRTDLERRLRERERQLQAVVSVTRALQARLALDELVHHAVLTAMDTVDADAGSLLLHDPERHTLVFRHVEGPAKERITGMEIAETQGIAGEVFQSGQARISQDVMTEKAHILDVDRAACYHTSSMITVPLQDRTGMSIGVLQVLNKRVRPFDNEDLEVLQVLASQVATAIINAKLYERAQLAAIVDLLGHLSHDIKNLLTPVSMAGQTLRMMLDDCRQRLAALCGSAGVDEAVAGEIKEITRFLGEDTREISDILDESAGVAQQRTKEFADIVKGMTAPLVFAPADVNDIVRKVTRILRLVAGKRGVTLAEELRPLPTVAADETRLYNAIYNLINNAIAATDPSGSVTVRTTAREDGAFPDGRYLEVQVADTGSGMPPKVAASLFTGNVRSTKSGGTGLGTRVVKTVVEAHGGRLYVNSVLGEGTTISARIPLGES